MGTWADYSSLTLKELNKLIAERVMGLKVGKAKPPWADAATRYSVYNDKGEVAQSDSIDVPEQECLLGEDGKPLEMMCIPGGTALVLVPRYSEYIALAWEMEAKLETLGKGYSSRIKDHPYMMYVCHLIKDVGLLEGWNNGVYTGNPHDFWDLLRATPYQRCVAALKAMDDLEWRANR